MVKNKNAQESTLISEFVVHGIQEKKGNEIVRLDLRNIHSSVADYFVVCHAESSTQLKAIAQSVEEEVFKGAVNTIDKLRPIILFEHVPEYLSEDSRDNYYWENLPSYEVFTIGENFTLSRMNPVIRQENCLAIPWEKMDYFSKPVLR